MKKKLIVLFLIVLFFNLEKNIAQPYKLSLDNLSSDIGFFSKYNKKDVFHPTEGFGGYIEPQYLIAKRSTIGIKAEYSFTQFAANKDTKLFNAAYYATYNYFITQSKNNPLRWYCGGGVGINFLQNWTVLAVNNQSTKLGNETKLGLMVRTGFYYRFINVNAEYKYIPYSTYYQQNFYNSYLSLNVGVSIHSKKHLQLGGLKRANIRQLNITNSANKIVPIQNNDYATVYFYRPQTFIGAAVVNKIWVGDSLCFMSNNSAYTIKVYKEGALKIYSIRKNIRSLILNTQKGKIYYVRFKHRISLAGKHRLELVDEETGKIEWAKIAR